MAVLNTANRIYSSGKLVYRIFLNTVLVYIDNFQVFKKRVLDDGGIFKETPIIFNDEKLLLTPNAYKTGKIYSALPHDGSGDFTFSRNSSATYIEDGIIKTALHNVPRFQNGKILIEGQATNLLRNNESFGTFNYRRDNLTLTNYSVVNSVNINYSELTAIADGNMFLVDSGNITDIRKNSVISLIVNKNTVSSIGLCFYRVSFINGALFNLVDNTFTITKLSGEFNAGIIPINDDYVRIWVSRESDPIISSAGLVYFGIYVNDATEGQTVEISGAMAENNRLYPSSYIPTNGSAVTRLADIATVTVPAGVTEIIETIDGVDNTITTMPPIYQLPVGEINKVIMK